MTDVDQSQVSGDVQVGSLAAYAAWRHDSTLQLVYLFNLLCAISDSSVPVTEQVFDICHLSPLAVPGG